MISASNRGTYSYPNDLTHATKKIKEKMLERTRGCGCQSGPSSSGKDKLDALGRLLTRIKA
ncbi:hypothetical protein MtrunA17_Chr7g0264241 [Medicago truncatula]|uniref:Uncharacterized protein n=1 Tax=Medicago truncatula TaxID=3880 RepID=A0A396H7H4_MEDTR|nr:hypothetical protein MtrunA17_Chr7g0264241 [Medicago truncatula]